MEAGVNSLKKEDARRFLEEVAQDYTTFARFEAWAENYNGQFKDYLSEVVNYIGKRNKEGRRIFALGEGEIEDILNATILLTAS